MHFLYWVEKVRGQYHSARKTWEVQNSPVCDEFPFKTLVGELVASKADDIANELSGLLHPDALSSDAKFAPVWKYIPHEHHAEARELIVAEVCLAACCWEKRIRSEARSFPEALFIVTQDPPCVKSTQRKRMAEQLLNMCPECLRRPHDDLAEKLRNMFLDEFTVMSETGECSPLLWGTIFLVQLMVQGETQEVESFHAHLQQVANRAPRMLQALANARLLLKFGKPITAKQCCELHAGGVEYQKSAGHRDRFGIVPLDDLNNCPQIDIRHECGSGAPPAPPGLRLCAAHADPLLVERAASIAARMYHSYNIGARYAYVVSGVGKRAFRFDRDAGPGLHCNTKTAGASWRGRRGPSPANIQTPSHGPSHVSEIWW